MSNFLSFLYGVFLSRNCSMVFQEFSQLWNSLLISYAKNELNVMKIGLYSILVGQIEQEFPSSLSRKGCHRVQFSLYRVNFVHERVQEVSHNYENA